MWKVLVASVLAWHALANLGADPMSAFEQSGPAPDYDLGRSVAHLLGRGCTVLTGNVLSVEPPDREPGVDADRAMTRQRFVVQVRESLHGGPATGSEVNLVHLTTPVQTKAGIGPWTAWRGLEVKPGIKLLICRWAETSSRPTWRGQPEDVALALSDEPRIERVRRLIADYERWQRAPGNVDRAAQDLRDHNDQAQAGCLVTYLAEGLAAREPDRGAVRLAYLLGQASLSPDARGQIADSLASNYFRLSAASRKVVTERLVEAGGGDNAPLIDAGFTALVRLAESKQLDLRPFPPLVKRKLSENYPRFLARKHLAEENAELSRQLAN
jgi:hypothetical protein